MLGSIQLLPSPASETFFFHWTNLQWFENKFLRKLKLCILNRFVPNTPFLYPLKTSENLKVVWCFQGVQKGCIGNKWVNIYNQIIFLNPQWETSFNHFHIIKFRRWFETSKFQFFTTEIRKVSNFDFFLGKMSLLDMFSTQEWMKTEI